MKNTLSACIIILSQDIHKNAGTWIFMDFWKLTKLAKRVNPRKAIFQYFYKYRIIVRAPSIPHCHCGFIINFLVNNTLIFAESHVSCVLDTLLHRS